MIGPRAKRLFNQWARQPAGGLVSARQNPAKVAPTSQDCLESALAHLNIQSLVLDPSPSFLVCSRQLVESVLFANEDVELEDDDDEGGGCLWLSNGNGRAGRRRGGGGKKQNGKTMTPINA